MSTPPPEERRAKPVSRAAELAAQQVEKIVEAAQSSAAQMTSAAEEEAQRLRAEASRVRDEAHQAAQAELGEARREAVQLGEESRLEAAARIADAQAAADDVLAETKAVSNGMRQLAHLLTTHAERILRDVQNSHRAISADLRAAGGGAGRDLPPEPAGETPRARRAPRPSAGGNPFDDIEPPEWVEEASGTSRGDG